MPHPSFAPPPLLPRAWDAPSHAEQRALEAIQEAYRQGHLPRDSAEADHADTVGLGAWSGPAFNDATPQHVPHPSEFQVDPLVVGGGVDRARLAREAKRLLDLDPTTKASTASITFGPTEASMRDSSRAGLDMGRFGGTTLLGITDFARPAHIGIQDRPASTEAGPQTRLSTLAHEIGHAAGLGEGAARGVSGLTAPLTQGARIDDDLKRALLARAQRHSAEAR